MARLRSRSAAEMPSSWAEHERKKEREQPRGSERVLREKERVISKRESDGGREREQSRHEEEDNTEKKKGLYGGDAWWLRTRITLSC